MLDFVTDKRGTILKASFEVFVTYGFRKTSMDDIARAAQMSRPGLYQIFKNKTDIFRALSEELMSNAAEKSEAALQGPGTFRERLFSALEAGFLSIVRVIDETPHGTELMGVNREIASDIEDRWVGTFRSVYENAMLSAEKAGEIRFRSTNAADTAQLLMHSMEGIKQEMMRGAKVEPYVRTLVAFFADSLEVKSQP